MTTLNNSLNAAKNGTRLRLTIGELPSVMKRQLQNVRKYRRELEALVVESSGDINTTMAHAIDEAVQAEVHSSVCRWLLRTRIESMSVSDITRCSEQILKAKSIRNRAVERLKLDRDETENIINALYSVKSNESDDDEFIPADDDNAGNLKDK